jgi:shikimate kinase
MSKYYITIFCKKQKLGYYTNMKTICLTGMMGSGKTSVAEIFAKNKNLRVIDIDSTIEKSEKMSVSEIFAQKGEDYFCHPGEIQPESI